MDSPSAPSPTRRRGAADIVWYATAHGYGHGVRSCDLMRELYRRRPGLAVTVSTGLASDFLQNRIGRASHPAFRARRLDVGMVQLDSVRVDTEATLAALARLVAAHDALVEGETRFLRESGARLVVADIPSIPLEAAKRCGIPAVAMGNFSWDWIYAAFAARDARWRPAVEMFAQGYAQADLLLELPFAAPMDAFPRKERIGCLARPGRNRREEIARETGADPAARWVLLSFSTLDWDAAAVANAAATPGTEFFTVKPLEWKGAANLHAMDRDRFPFADVVASADAVVTKPGYGILSDCLANGKPLVGAERRDFAEYPVLVEALQRHFRSVPLSEADLYAGRLAEALAALERQPAPPEPVPRDGAETAAERLLSFL